MLFCQILTMSVFQCYYKIFFPASECGNNKKNCAAPVLTVDKQLAVNCQLTDCWHPSGDHLNFVCSLVELLCLTEPIATSALCSSLLCHLLCSTWLMFLRANRCFVFFQCYEIIHIRWTKLQQPMPAT